MLLTAARIRGDRHRDQPAGQPAQGALRRGEVRRGREATDQEILDAKVVLLLADWGCEPAMRRRQCPTRKLVQDGVIAKTRPLACVPTGHAAIQDLDATVAYHTADPTVFEAELGKRGVRCGLFANLCRAGAQQLLPRIAKAIELYA